MITRSRVTYWIAVMMSAAVWLAAWGARPVHEPDSASYLEVGADLADGTLDRLSSRTPGYALLLLASGALPEPGAALVIVQLALHVGSVAAILVLLRRLGVTTRDRALVAMVALSPPFAEHAVYVLSESLCQAIVVSVLAGSVLFVLDGGRAALAVATLGFAVVGLVHPAWAAAAFVLPPVVAASGCLRGLSSRSTQRARLIGAIGITAAAIVLGVFVAHQRQKFHFTGLAPTLGTSLSHKTGRLLEAIPDVYATEREILIAHRNASLVDPGGDHQAHAFVFRAIPELETATGLRGAALDERLARIQIGLIARHPMEYGDEVLRSWLWYWSPGVSPPGGLGVPALRHAGNGLRAVVNASFGLALVLVAGPLWWDTRRRRRNALADRARDRDELLFALVVLLSAVFLSAGLSSALTAAVWRLRVPVDLAILGSIPLLMRLGHLLEDAISDPERAG